MTNTQIIFDELVARGFSSEQLHSIMEVTGDLPFHTFQEWKSYGYAVKKGEKAMFSAKLWQFTNKPNMAARKRAQERGEEINEDPHFYKKSSSIFGFSQVKRLDTGDPHPIMAAYEERKKQNAFMAPAVYKKPCTALTII